MLGPQWDDLIPYLADVDGDGRDDLLVSGTSQGDGTMVVQAALAGDQSFGEPEPVLDLGASDHPVTGVGDFDGDGDDDLFRATNTYDGAAELITGVEVEPYLNEEGAFAAGEATALDETTWAVGWFLAGDPDGDGVDDLVVTNGRGGDVARIALADGAFGQPTTWLAGGIPDEKWEAVVGRRGGQHYKHALSDVDGDGDDDLLSARTGREAGLQVAVALAEDDRFGSWDVWGTIDECTRDECGLITLVANVQPSIL